MEWRDLFRKWRLYLQYYQCILVVSTATLNLTINTSSSSSSKVAACDNFEWNGETYSESGVYTYSTTNASGCDSTATLNLTINTSSSSSVTEVACDNFAQFMTIQKVAFILTVLLIYLVAILLLP